MALHEPLLTGGSSQGLWQAYLGRWEGERQQQVTLPAKRAGLSSFREGHRNIQYMGCIHGFARGPTKSLQHLPSDVLS